MALTHYLHGDKLPVPIDVVDVGGVTLVMDPEDPAVLGVESVDETVVLVVGTLPVDDGPRVVPSELEGFVDVPIEYPDDRPVGLLRGVRLASDGDVLTLVDEMLVDDNELLVSDDPPDDVRVEDELPNVESDALVPGGQGCVSDDPLVGVVEPIELVVCPIELVLVLGVVVPVPGDVVEPDCVWPANATAAHAKPTALNKGSLSNMSPPSG